MMNKSTKETVEVIEGMILFAMFLFVIFAPMVLAYVAIYGENPFK